MTATEVAIQQPTNVAALPTRHVAPSSDIFSDAANLDHANRVAKVFAASTLVPPHFQNNLPNCLIALQIARRLNEDAMTVMQQLFLINGRPGWYVKYMISRVNRAGIFKSPITWHEVGEGDALAVTAKAVLAATGEEIHASADMRMAAAEGWTKNAKYRSMPAHMLRWRSAAMLINLYAPEVMLGIPAVEELETMPKMRDVTPAKNLAERLDALAKMTPAEAGETHDPDTGEITTPTPADVPRPRGDGPAPAAGQPAPESVSPPARGWSGSQDAPSAPAGPPASESNPSQGTGPGAGEAATRRQDAVSTAGAATAKAEDEPKTAADYIQTTEYWIESLRDANAGNMRWKSEKTARNRLNVNPDDRDRLDAKLKAKIAILMR